MYLLKLASQLPSSSPIDSRWVDAPTSLRPLSALIHPLFQDVRCASYRARFDKMQQALMREKLITSQVRFMGVC
jgi:hypothetical protein